MRNPLLVPDLRELIHAGEEAGLRDFFADHHPGQIAELIEDLETDEGDALFRLLPPEPGRGARAISTPSDRSGSSR